MTTPRKAIKLRPDEDQFLRSHHRQSGIPDGQFPQRPQEWRKFTDDWNAATDRGDSPEELLHYIVCKRKKGLWFRFDGTHKPLSCPDLSILTPDQWQTVHSIYLDIGEGADNFLYDRGLRKRFVSEYVNRTGHHVPELLFTAALIARRKSGWLPRVDKPEGGSFGDFDKIAV